MLLMFILTLCLLGSVVEYLIRDRGGAGLKRKERIKILKKNHWFMYLKFSSSVNCFYTVMRMKGRFIFKLTMRHFI